MKVDARSARWREHRKKVRAEILDAAFRAIDRHGPEVSLQQIAAEAGTAKPKIYRHFADKADLSAAIARRLRDMLVAAILPAIDPAAAPIREVLRRGVGEYVALVDVHPNVVRLVLAGRGVQEGRDITMAIAEMFNHELRELALDRAALELAAAATFGSAAAATEWWLGPEVDSPRRMASAEFVEHLTTIMLGTVNGTADLLGVHLDPDLPIRAAAASGAPSG